MEILPVIISLVALFFSGISLGWTIYRDTQKPTFRVSVAVNRVTQRGAPPSEPFICVEAVNIGPTPNRVGLVFVRKSWWQRKFGNRDKATAFVAADYAHLATSPQSVLAERIEIGEGAQYAFPFNSECFLREEWAEIGVADGYGQMHWAPKYQLAKLRKKFLEEFR